MNKKTKIMVFIGGSLAVIFLLLFLSQFLCDRGSLCIWNIFGDYIPTSIENSIINQLNEDSPLIIYPDKLEMSKGQKKIIGIGIFNKDRSFHDFNLRILFMGDENKINIDDWFKIKKEGYGSKDNSKKIVPLNVVVPKNSEAGEYNFKIKLLKDNGFYAEKEFSVSVIER